MAYLIEALGNLTIKNGSIDCPERGIHVNGKYEVNLENVKINATERCIGGYNGCTINVDENCVLTTTGNDAALFVYGDANTADLTNTVVVKGKIYNTGTEDCWAISGNGNGNRAKSDITIEEGAYISSTNYPAIYQPQGGLMTINGGEIVGTDGVYLKSGKVVINGGKITGTGDFVYKYNGDGTDTIGHSVTVDFLNYPNGYPVLEINDGEFISEHKSCVEAYYSDKTTKIYGKTLDDNNEELANLVASNISIKGGTFNTDVRNEFKKTEE